MSPYGDLDGERVNFWIFDIVEASLKPLV